MILTHQDVNKNEIFNKNVCDSINSRVLNETKNFHIPPTVFR